MQHPQHSEANKEELVAGALGDIKINHSVVASIVRLAALNAEGVYSVGGGFVDSIAEVFSKKESDRGVRVSVDENGDYVIQVRVIMRFGVELAKVATQVQEHVREQVQRMTSNDVSRVDVIIDGVKLVQANSEREDRDHFSMHDHPHTD
jgi:uncharacterized alkaline shock family protein YloU